MRIDPTQFRWNETSYDLYDKGLVGDIYHVTLYWDTPISLRMAYGKGRNRLGAILSALVNSIYHWQAVGSNSHI